MKSIYNTYRTPKKGDWIKLPEWGNFFQISEIKPMINGFGLGIVFVGYENNDFTDYNVNGNWIYQE